MHRRVWAAAAVVALTGGLLTLAGAPSQASPTGRFTYRPELGRPQLSGAASPDLLTGSQGVVADRTSRLSAQAVSDDVQINGDNKADPRDQFGSGAGWPANETAIVINPTDPSNVIAAANDYEPAVDGTIGIYASFDGGHTWPYSRHSRQVVTPNRAMYGTGDPVVAFDRDGVAYASFIAFGRANCDSYVATIRSTDRGVTWSTPFDDVQPGLEAQLGDGIVVHNGGADDCGTFHDKEWMTTGRRPQGVPLVSGTDPRYVSSDRLYLTWTRFDFGPGGGGFVESPIYIAYSDDQGRHWSFPAEISGRSPLCAVQDGDQDGDACDESQFSVPVVDPRNGHLYVVYVNSNTSSLETNRYLMVKSTDGGATFEAPRRVADLYTGAAKYPECAGNRTLDLMCARVNGAGNVDVDPNTGQLYVTYSDNRNGTAEDTNTDVFVATSTDGGQNWTRRNLTAGSIDDQWFPWLSVAPDGTVAVAYYDRRYSGPKLIDTSLAVSTDAGTTFARRRVSDRAWNPDLAFRLGVFIGDYNGLDTVTGVAIPCWTDARFAEPNVADNNPPNQQSDIMVDVEPIPTR